MKKQLIAAAVAASMSAVAMADVSITGNANYEYFHNTVGGATESTNSAGDMEVNLQVVGKTGDTSVVANFEISGASAQSGGASVDNDADGNVGAIDVEDLYITTKVGDINVKAGDYASGTTALGGEIDEGGRVHNKVDLSTTIGGATIGYAVNSESASDDDFKGSDAVAYGSMDIAGMKFSVKDASDSYTLLGVSGEQGGIKFRIENKDSDTANSDVLFYELSTKIAGVDVSFAAIDADAANTSSTDGLITETDSTVFAQDAHDLGLDGINQVTLGTSVDGTAVKLRAGTRTGGAVSGGSTYQDADFMEVSASRPLASGATMTVTYSDWENVTAVGSTMYDNQTLEIDLSVKF
jgi:hypothetical protein